MGFKLPDIHEISIDVAGRRFDGSWYIILHDMVVNYNGHAASTPQRASDAEEVALSMLRDLVAKHYMPLESIPPDIPPAIRIAAHQYVNSNDDESVTADFVASFGPSVASSAVHRQLSWLCVNALSMIVPAWQHMCDSNVAEETFHALRKWLQAPRHEVDWQTATSPAVALRDGVRVGDCDACRLEPIADAVASAARYLQSADSADASACLLSVSYAYDEGCHTRDAPDRFEKWLVFDVLQTSLECLPVHEVM
ncbi:hypothetical protein C5Y96_23805 [Blastopirellula marina]|uniref:Uncharacterized protein n=1 Tax=Blastopirellula marina TaxID=124 RepID=A0A2S8EZM6_9BACT|nr:MULTISPECIES: hypothetical protein [Pirellulaceae]PQO25369.1 hypothetical protein C5Y96_23805 [Blastopirellula marina]RCS42333.1 hypothetical protein DTL36_23855 [Bremerella cremea]